MYKREHKEISSINCFRKFPANLLEILSEISGQCSCIIFGFFYLGFLHLLQFIFPIEYLRGGNVTPLNSM